MLLLPHLLALAVLGASPAPDAGASVTDPSSFVLGLGAQMVLPVKHLKAVAATAPSVLDVRPLGPGVLLLVGLDAGHSDLLVARDDGSQDVFTVEIMDDPPDDEASSVRSIFPESPDLTIRIIGDRVFLTGLFGSLEDVERSLRYPNAVCLARLDPKVVQAKVDEVNAALAHASLKGAQAVLHGSGTLVLEGTVQDPEDKAKAQKIADALFGPVAQAIAALERR